MDAQRLLEFSEALKEERRLERLAAQSTEQDAREIARLLSGVRRNVNSLQQALMSTYEQDFVECRDMGHVWRRLDAHPDGDVLIRTLICERCDTERHESFGRYGDIDSRRYHHKPGYLLPKGARSGDRTRYTASFWRGITFMQATRNTR